MTATVPETVGVDEFREQARAWLAANMEPSDHALVGDDEVWARARAQQKRLHHGGFAGICFPREYGGLGLSASHQRAFNEEAAAYDMPLVLNIPTFAICAATLLETGSDEQKARFVPRILRGEDIWCQLLSEPRGGSDLAGVSTRASRDGDEWVINGSKIWSSSAHAADFGLCLTRTNWDVPKHAGLTMFAMPLDAEGVSIQRIRMVDGSMEFCQVFFDDVRLPGDAVVGNVDQGWEVAGKQMFHERNSMGGGSPYVSGRRHRAGTQGPDLIGLARTTGTVDDPLTRDHIAKARVMEVIGSQLAKHISASIASGAMAPQASSVLRLFSAEQNWARHDAEILIGGATVVAGHSPTERGNGDSGLRYLSRQAGSLGGGSTEIARNIISERLLGMPREYAPDRGIPYKDVPKGSA